MDNSNTQKQREEHSATPQGHQPASTVLDSQLVSFNLLPCHLPTQMCPACRIKGAAKECSLPRFTLAVLSFSAVPGLVFRTSLCWRAGRRMGPTLPEGVSPLHRRSLSQEHGCNLRLLLHIPVHGLRLVIQFCSRVFKSLKGKLKNYVKVICITGTKFMVESRNCIVMNNLSH